MTDGYYFKGYVKITDNRTKNERKLKDIEIGQYFTYNDVLCRRVKLYDGYKTGEYEGLPVIEIRSGMVSCLNGDNWVVPIGEGQVCLSLEDR